jgi:hypothetical protein
LAGSGNSVVWVGAGVVDGETEPEPDDEAEGETELDAEPELDGEAELDGFVGDVDGAVEDGAVEDGFALTDPEAVVRARLVDADEAALTVVRPGALTALRDEKPTSRIQPANTCELSLS